MTSSSSSHEKLRLVRNGWAADAMVGNRAGDKGRRSPPTSPASSQTTHCLYVGAGACERNGGRDWPRTRRACPTPTRYACSVASFESNGKNYLCRIAFPFLSLREFGEPQRLLRHSRTSWIISNEVNTRFLLPGLEARIYCCSFL